MLTSSRNIHNIPVLVLPLFFNWPFSSSLVFLVSVTDAVELVTYLFRKGTSREFTLKKAALLQNSINFATVASICRVRK